MAINKKDIESSTIHSLIAGHEATTEWRVVHQEEEHDSNNIWRIIVPAVHHVRSASPYRSKTSNTQALVGLFLFCHLVTLEHPIVSGIDGAPIVMTFFHEVTR